MILSRRSLLLTGSLGLGALSIPGLTAAGTVAALRGFTHAVASGEPRGDSVLLWTRYVPSVEAPVRLAVEVAETADFARIVSGGAAITGPWRDYTAKITVEGLRPGQTYHYRFVAPDGTRSPAGRTRTLPEGLPRQFRAAVFSCSNLPFGWFNAYAHAVARGDLDLVIHLGDYFYEYQTGDYPSHGEGIAGRRPEPANEVVSLADYRLRYASYRADPDLQALHAAVPWVVQWDDHESANDSWEGGAENHQPATEGDWSPRRDFAVQAYREWMPVSDQAWDSFDIGELATLYRTETRVLARTHQLDTAPLFAAADPTAALKAFRDGPWQDPAVTMMGTQQEDWLFHAMRRSVKAGQRWQIVGFGTVMGQMVMPAEAASWVDPAGTPRLRSYVASGIAAARVGLPFNYDDWGGYPAARARFLRAAQAAGGSTVVITGDSHNAWAFDLAQDGHPAAVEFAGHSVTSPGFESALRADPRTVAAGLVRANPELRWADTSRRGYMALTITPDRVTNDWVFVDTVRSRTPRAGVGYSASVERGRNVMG